MLNNASNQEVRKTGLGGSDISVVMGLNPWKTPLELYLEKRGEIEPTNLDDNEAVQWGVKLEDLIALAYAEKTGRKVRRNNQTLRHPNHSWMMAHLDREIVGLHEGQRGGLECKNTSEYQSNSWGDEYTDDFPAHYRAQVIWYMAITRKDFFHLAVLIGGNKHRVYQLNAADVIQETAEMIEAGREFWERVMAGNPPSPINADDLLLNHPTDTSDFAFASELDQVAIRSLIKVKAQIKDQQNIQSDLEFELKKAIGDAAILLGPNKKPLATWKTTETNRVDTKALKAAEPELVKSHTVTTSSRRFTIKPKNIQELTQ